MDLHYYYQYYDALWVGETSMKASKESDYLVFGYLRLVHLYLDKHNEFLNIYVSLGKHRGTNRI